MKLWQSELTVSKTYILRNHVVKVYCGQTFIGFYALISYGEGNWEVDHLWLTAENIRKGYGKEIFRHMIEHIRNAGGTRITLTAEPNAKGFYEKMGGKVIRRLESKIVGRFLEEYEFRTAT
ncbi:acetyltransferase (GNAT) family protein [Pontibacter ummariensis]|uniref:Acetyltransferase (GNAT) domain-containing protein n=2 Tax=Pontibacter ummariensis TaxID=1610492 RepID=A0A239LMQ3_9BACT|nr:acetyltransferase (GNAT) family protein [Pontibacter ummariensis]SNT31761.1 Acetyltransferase (GNAT) domain-containing protein [Pontibacter ummariensis]